jgi:Ca-activated chloride channel family protein
VRWLAALIAIAVTVCGCSRQAEQPGANSRANPNAFRILAGSELKELGPAIENAARQAGVQVVLSYAGTLDMVDRVNAGEPFEAILPANGAYPSLALAKQPSAKEKLFYSRVALGVKASKAKALGWDNAPPTWKDIAAAVKAHKFSYAMTNPVSSNTGMSALFAVASSIAGKTEDLSIEEVDRTVLKDFLAGQKLTAGSSGWLADAYVREQRDLDGIVNYEAVLLRLNDRPEVTEKLVIIYPRDGVISADYPLMLLDDSRRADYEKLVGSLKETAFQSDALAREYLRPANPDAKRSPALSDATVAELTFPNRLEVIDTVLLAYQGELRRPATSIYVLDVSGSMEGERLQALKSALGVLTGADTKSLTSRFARFQNRERVVLLPFSNEPEQPREFGFDTTDAVQRTNESIREFVDGLRANGGTAIYASLDAAYELAARERVHRPDRVVTIVLLTDGENRDGMSFGKFQTSLTNRVAESGGGVRIFPIVFGEAPPSELETVAAMTGGRAFDGRKGSLTDVFKEIRGYQ